MMHEVLYQACINLISKILWLEYEGQYFQENFHSYYFDCIIVFNYIINIIYCRYLINYAPFDFVYKLCKFSPIKLVISLLKEIQRTNKVHHGILFALRNFPGSYILVALFGVLKGSLL